MKKEAEFKTTYVSWNIPTSNSFAEFQSEFCKKYDLIARNEIHVTLGFIGEAEKEHICALVNNLKSLFDEQSFRFKINGIGGATVIDTQNTLITNEFLKEKKIHSPRVFWFSIDLSEELKRSRLLLSAEVKGVGLDNSKITEYFCPHITIGSNGPAGDRDWSLWDVHNVNKGTYIIPSPISYIDADKFHITDVSTHPESICIINNYD